MTRIALLGLTALLLASCGRQGDLARPGPLFGGSRDAAQSAGQGGLQDRDGDAVEGASDPVGGRPSTSPGTSPSPGA